MKTSTFVLLALSVASVFVASTAQSDECGLVEGIKCAEAVAPCISQCKSGLEPCLECLAGDFQTCCSCIEKVIPKLPFQCSNATAVEEEKPTTTTTLLTLTPSALRFDDECGLVEGIQCGESVAKCVSECKNGTEACLECLAGDYQTCCPCIKKVLPKAPITCNSEAVRDEPTCDLENGLQCGEGIAKCVSECKQGLEPCAECLAGDFQPCCPCIKKIIPKAPVTCSDVPAPVADGTCDLDTGLACGEGVAKCVDTCKQGLEPCVECLAGDFQTCCPCIEKVIPKLPFQCS